MQLSEHFMFSQFDQPAAYGCAAVKYPHKWITDRAMLLAAVLEAVCSELGGYSMTVTSGYRSRAFNQALRAAGYPVARNSQHCEGRAVDVVFEGLEPTEVYVTALSLHRRGRIRLGGLGLYPSWVHLDIRAGSLQQWLGRGPIR
jgi:uncharacterized protein YcbK (DUF882 family)